MSTSIIPIHKSLFCRKETKAAETAARFLSMKTRVSNGKRDRRDLCQGVSYEQRLILDAQPFYSLLMFI
jgi:hypothetical protein